MRKIVIIVILMAMSIHTNAQNQSISFLGSSIIFGSVLSDFIESNPDYQITNEREVISDVKVYKKSFDLSKYSDFVSLIFI